MLRIDPTQAPFYAAGNGITDNTAALQAAMDALAAAGGGLYDIPAGVFITQGLNLPTPAYSNIHIRGAGQDQTILRNVNVNADMNLYLGVLSIGNGTNTPNRVNNVCVSDLTIQEVPLASQHRDVVYSMATSNVEFRNCRITGGSYEGLVMGGGYKSINWRVHNCLIDNCGMTGPAWTSSPLSGLNLNGENWIAHDNVITNCGMGVEMGSRYGKLYDNVFTNLGLPGGGSVAVAVGSTGSGIWCNEVAGNLFDNCYIGVSNPLGTCNRTTIRNNRFINGSVQLSSGQETNSVNEGPLDTVIHGVSYIKDNVFAFDAPLVTTPITIGSNGGKEDVILDGNVFDFLASALPHGSGSLHQIMQLAQSSTQRVFLRNTTISAPPGVLTNNSDLQLNQGVQLGQLRITNLACPYDFWVYQWGNPTYPAIMIPAS